MTPIPRSFPVSREVYVRDHRSESLGSLLRKRLFSAGQRSLLIPAARRWCAARLGIHLGGSADSTGSLARSVWIGKDVYLDDVFPELITLRAGCVLGLRSMLICHDDATRQVAPIEIGEGAYVGAGAIILPGVNVGTGAKIGAGAVVTKNVPAGETWVGVPAHPLRSASEERECPPSPAMDALEV
ncbi:MAG: DapH/DapD/GlmU-related protein [Planctomycetota bacterium]